MVPKLSVIVVHWNSEGLLAKCLAALERQTYKNFRVIVVDNASDPALFREAVQCYPGAEIIRLQENVGFSTASNLAVQSAKGSDWIALVNPDAYPEPDWLENLISAAQMYPDYSFFGSRMVMSDDAHLLDGAGDVYHVIGLFWRRGYGVAAENRYLDREEIFSPCAAAALYRRDIFLDSGGFDEDYFCYAEDVDLGFRLRLAGQRCLYVPNAVVHHVGSASSKRHSDFYIYHGQRNLVWTYFKNMPSPLFWKYLPAHLLLNIFSLFWFIFRGHGKAILKAKRDAARGIPAVWKKRRHIQKSKKVGPAEIDRVLAKGLPIRNHGYDKRGPGIEDRSSV